MNTLVRQLESKRIDMRAFARNEGKECVLVNADCKTVLPLIETKSVNVVIIDPPYGAQTQNNSTKTWDFAWKAFEWNEIVAEVFRILKPGGHFVVFSGGKTLFDIHPHVQTAYRAAFSNDPSFTHIIWNHYASDSGTVHSHVPRSQFENIMVYWRTGESRIMEQHGCLTQTDRFFHHTGRSNVIHAYKDDDRSKPEKVVQDWFKKMDATSGGKVSTFDMKPEQLLQFLIRDYSDVDGTVLDFCMNHGITGVAALNMKRRFIGVEVDLAGYELAKARIADKFNLPFIEPLHPHGLSTPTTSRRKPSKKRSYPRRPVYDAIKKIIRKKEKTVNTKAEAATKAAAKAAAKAATKAATKQSRKSLRSETHDPLNILHKKIEIGTAKTIVPVYVKSVEPSVERNGGRYVVVHEDGKEMALTIWKKMIQAVC